MSDLVRLQILFDKYLNRYCSPQEVEEMIGLLSKTQADDVIDPSMHHLWEQIKNETAVNHVDWHKMYTYVTSNHENNIASMPKRSWLKYAAAVLVPLITFSVFYFTKNKPVKNNLQPLAVINAPLQKQSASSARQTIHLPDGSTAILNQGSKLNYPPVFKGKSRDVYLSGEGFFDIEHNPKQPFIVHTGKLSVKVLGTAFNIKTSSSRQTVEVTVTRGKVQVLNEDKSIGIITASQQLLFTTNTETVTKKMVDTIPVIAWKPAEIFFNDISMEEVAKRMKERFGIVIEFENAAVKNCRVSATFSEDDLPEEIIAVVCAVIKSDYTIGDKKITIRGKGCN